MNQTITLSAWLNDEMAKMPLSAQSIRFCDSLCIDESPESSEFITQRTVPQGSWSLDTETGLISFTPMRDWHGTVSINYAIWATDGKMAHSTVTVVIRPPQEAPQVLADSGFSNPQLFVMSLLMLLVGVGLTMQNGRRSI
jgi:hypothetical protein